jgi:hypothetical protein
LCCRCLIEGKISRGIFASYLDIDRADIDPYLNKFGFRENNYEELAKNYAKKVNLIGRFGGY